MKLMLTLLLAAFVATAAPKVIAVNPGLKKLALHIADKRKQPKSKPRN